MTKRLSFILMLFFFAGSIQAQDIFGQWKTVDDETGKEKSIVEIYKKGDKVYGKIVKLLNREPGDENPICDECTDDRKNQHMVGMEIIRDMEKDGDKYSSGTIMDPGNGKSYDCKLWLDEENPKVLKLRGYIAFFYRTQTWYKVD